MKKSLLTTTSPLSIDERCMYTPTSLQLKGSISDVKEFIANNTSIVGVGIIPFDIDKQCVRFYALKPTERDIEIVSVFIDGDVNIKDLWNMLNLNIFNYFKKVLAPIGYDSPMDPENDVKEGEKLSVEKWMIRTHLIRKGKAIDFRYAKSVFYQKSIVNRYCPAGYATVSFLQFGNTSGKEFDAIRVTMPVIMHGKSRSEILGLMRENTKAFNTAAATVIKNSRRFRSSGFTLNYFEISTVALTHSMELVYTFDVKKRIRDLLQ